MGDEAREHMRQCWGCDCDGKSHKRGTRPSGAARQAVDIVANGIEKLTGFRPPTCPWRAMYDPLVQPVIDLRRLGKEGLGANALTDDDPAILWDAVTVYLRAHNATQASDEAGEHKKRMAEMRKKPRG